MSKFLLDYDPETRTTQYLHTDTDGKAVIESIQDVEPILDFNKLAAERHDKKKDWWFIGNIPLQVCQQWAQESGTKVFSKAWLQYAKKQVQDPDYRKLNPNNIKLGR